MDLKKFLRLVGKALFYFVGGYIPYRYVYRPLAERLSARLRKRRRRETSLD